MRIMKFEKNEFKFTLLVDLSGSMQGDKIQETFKSVAMVAEVLHNVGIDFAVYGFQDEVYEFKSFGQEYDDSVRDRMVDMLELVSGEGCSHNSDGYCVDKVYGKVLANLTKTNLFLVMSDGLPAPGENRVDSSVDANEELKAVIKTVEANQDVGLIGFGVGPDTNHVRNFYSDSVIASNVKNVPDKIKKKLVEVIAV